MARLSTASLTVGDLAVNCWFLANEDTKEALVFDRSEEHTSELQSHLT